MRKTLRRQPGLQRGSGERRAKPRLCLEGLESRELLSGQTPLITDATPYSAAFVNGLYRDALGRSADSGALDWFVALLNQGRSSQTVATAVVDSDEYAANVVQTAYRQYLGRNADSAAVSTWVNGLHAGGRDEQLIAALVASDEFYIRAGNNDAAWVAAAYQAVLGRAAATDDIAWATNQLALGRSRFMVAYDLASSVEHEWRVAQGNFTHYLHTQFDAQTVNDWAASLATGQKTDETMIAEILGTNAYYEVQTGVPPTVVPVPGMIPGWATRNAQIEASAAQGGTALVFLGDSITQAWQLDGAKVWAQYYAPFNALNEGIAADQTQNVLWRIENGDLNGLAPKVIVLMVGVNNFASDDSPQEVADGVAADVAAIRQRLPETKILLLSILPAVLTNPPLNLMGPIAATNQLLATLADGRNVFYLDLWPAFTNPDGTNKSELHVSDGLHLNAQGYAVLAQSIAPDLSYLLIAP